MNRDPRLGTYLVLLDIISNIYTRLRSLQVAAIKSLEYTKAAQRKKVITAASQRGQQQLCYPINKSRKKLNNIQCTRTTLRLHVKALNQMQVHAQQSPLNVTVHGARCTMQLSKETFSASMTYRKNDSQKSSSSSSRTI
jgi:hypothetical protein